MGIGKKGVRERVRPHAHLFCQFFQPRAKPCDQEKIRNKVQLICYYSGYFTPIEAIKWHQCLTSCRFVSVYYNPVWLDNFPSMVLRNPHKEPRIRDHQLTSRPGWCIFTARVYSNYSGGNYLHRLSIALSAYKQVVKCRNPRIDIRHI